MTIPGYQAFLLDAQVDDDGKSESFVDDVNDVKIIDPKTRTSAPQPQKRTAPIPGGGLPMAFHLVGQGLPAALLTKWVWGKSVQLLSLVEARKGSGPALIVCPASSGQQLGRRMRKIHARSDHRSRGLHESATAQAHRSRGTAMEEPLGIQRVPQAYRCGWITSDDLLRRDVDDYAACRFALMALDEAQYIKNHATKLAKAVKHCRTPVRIDGNPHRKPVERTVEHLRLPHARIAGRST